MVEVRVFPKTKQIEVTREDDADQIIEQVKQQIVQLEDGELKLRALSDAVTTAIIAAEFLVNNSEAIIEDMTSKVFTVDGMQRVEMIITLKRIPPKIVSEEEKKEMAMQKQESLGAVLEDLEDNVSDEDCSKPTK